MWRVVAGKATGSSCSLRCLTLACASPLLSQTGRIHNEPLETLESSRDGRVSILTLNRPNHLNAVNSVMTREILACLNDNDANGEIAATVITGKGNAFCAGADLKEIAGWISCQKVDECTVGKWRRIEEIEKPIIAAVNGIALGGGSEVAMMCDIVLASDKAVFVQPEVKVGLIPGMGATQRLVRAVGKSKAMEVLLTGASVSAEEALALGIVSRIVNSEELISEAVKLGKRIGSYSLPVVAKLKKCVKDADKSLEKGLDSEYERFLSCFHLADASEGTSAFFEKRSPNWKDQ